MPVHEPDLIVFDGASESARRMNGPGGVVGKTQDIDVAFDSGLAADFVIVAIEMRPVAVAPSPDVGAAEQAGVGEIAERVTPIRHCGGNGSQNCRDHSARQKALQNDFHRWPCIHDG